MPRKRLSDDPSSTSSGAPSRTTSTSRTGTGGDGGRAGEGGSPGARRLAVGTADRAPAPGPGKSAPANKGAGVTSAGASRAAPPRAAASKAPSTGTAPKAAPATDAPAKTAPTKAAPTKAAPTKVAVTKAAPIKAAATKAAGTKAAPTKAGVSKATRAKSSPEPEPGAALGATGSPAQPAGKQPDRSPAHRPHAGRGSSVTLPVPPAPSEQPSVKPSAPPVTSATGPLVLDEVIVDVSAPKVAAGVSRRRSRSARPTVPVALGSLTQPGARGGETCAACGSARVTTLALMLTDGTPVRFTSCHACEHRSWVGPDGELDRTTVLARTRKDR